MTTTLEEYQIVIAANAESAARGINTFRDSLSSFSSALQTCMAPIKEFANAIQDIASASYRIDFGRIANQAEKFARAMGRVSSAANRSGRGGPAAPLDYAEDFARSTSYQEMLEMQRNGAAQGLARELGRNNMDEGRVASLVGRFNKADDAIRASTSRVREMAAEIARSADQASILQMRMEGVRDSIAKELASQNPNEGRIASLSQQYQNLQAKLVQVQQQAESTGKSLGQSMGEAAQSGLGKVEKFLGRIGRIMSTMLIRNAMKTLVKAFSSAWDAMEAYSKSHGGELAKNMELIRGAVSQAAVSLASSLAPAMRVVAAVASVAANAIKVLAVAVNWLMGLLGASTEFLGATSDALDGYASSSGGASKSNKDLLASFDELNVIQSSSGGGGGGGGGGWDLTSFNADLSAELAAISMIIAESMLAVGLILAFTGHPGIGIPMMVIGAAGIVAQATINWGGLSENVREQCLKIMVIAGASMLAIGAIIAIACPSHAALGIALMAAGAANLVGAVALAWGETSGKVRDEIGAILVYCGTGLLAIGAILALSGVNLPLGIALMAAGGVALVSAVALNWESLKQSVVGVFQKIGAGISAAWETVKTAVGNAWNAVKEWAKAKWASFKPTWDKIKGGFSAIWGKISEFASKAWEPVKTWIKARWNDFKSGWEKIKEGFKAAWEKISGFVMGAWESVKTWAKAKWTDFKAGWEKIKEGFKGAWDKISGFVTGAWESVKKWANAKWTSFQQSWNDIRDNLRDRWDTVKTAVSDAWKKVSDWLGARWDDFKTGWGVIEENLGSAWDTVKTAVSDAWKKVQEWATAKWSKLEGDWENIKDNFSKKWEGIKTSVTNAWNMVQKWAKASWSQLKGSWDDIRDNFSGKWNDIKGAVSNAWKQVQTWAGAKWSQLKGNWEDIKDNFSGKWNDIKGSVINAWKQVQQWAGAKWTKLQGEWDKIKENFSGKWNEISDAVSGAWDQVQQWAGTKWDNFKTGWENIKQKFFDIWSGRTSISSAISSAWSALSNWWNTTASGPIQMIESAWSSLVGWFEDNITKPISDAFNSAISTIKGLVNDYIIRPLNSLGKISYAGLTLPLIGEVIPAFSTTLWSIPELKAEGEYNIKNGQLFIANEAGPELVGQMNGHTSVANQMQIIEGIRQGVRDANEDQNALLRQQNELLLEILQKDSGSFASEANIAFGRFAKRSIALYNQTMGGK